MVRTSGTTGCRWRSGWDELNDDLRWMPMERGSGEMEHRVHSEDGSLDKLHRKQSSTKSLEFGPKESSHGLTPSIWTAVWSQKMQNVLHCALWMVTLQIWTCFLTVNFSHWITVLFVWITDCFTIWKCTKKYDKNTDKTDDNKIRSEFQLQRPHSPQPLFSFSPLIPSAAYSPFTFSVNALSIHTLPSLRISSSVWSISTLRITLRNDIKSNGYHSARILIWWTLRNRVNTNGFTKAKCFGWFHEQAKRSHFSREWFAQRTMIWLGLI